MIDWFSYDVIAQAVGVLGSAFIVGGYFLKTDNNSKKVIIIGSLLFAAHFLMIGAVTGALMNVINFFRVGLSIKFHKSKKLFFFFIATYLVAAYFTYSQPVDFLPLISSLVGTFSMYFLSGLAFRFCVLLSSSSWLTHNILIGSVGGIITELFVLFATFTVIYRLYIDRKRDSNDQNT